MTTILNLYLISAGILTLYCSQVIYKHFSRRLPLQLIFLPSFCLFLFGQRVFIFNIIPLTLDLFSGSSQLATYSPSATTVISFGLLFFIGSIAWVLSFLFSYVKFTNNKYLAKGTDFADNHQVNIYKKKYLSFLNLSLVIAVLYPILAYFSKIGLLPIPTQLVEISSRFLGFSGSILFVIFFQRKFYIRSFFAIGAQILFIVFVSNSRSTLAFPFLIIFALLFKGYDSFALMRKSVYYLFISTLIGLFILIGSVPKLSVDKGSFELSYSLNVEKNHGRTSFQELNYRLGAPIRYSFAFYEFTRSIKFSLVDNNLQKITSLLNPSGQANIVPNSVDRNDLFSQPGYLIYRYYHENSFSTMSEFEYTAIESWQFGLLGALLASSFSGFLYGLSASIIRSIFTPYIAIIAIIALQIPWCFDPRIPIYYYLYLSYTYYPFLLLLFFFKLRFKL